jgi:hypothetical protein
MEVLPSDRGRPRVRLGTLRLTNLLPYSPAVARHEVGRMVSGSRGCTRGAIAA